MSIAKDAFRGASWLAVSDAGSRVFSWLVTILVARILVPADYGLMSLATIFTAYTEIFSELGLGAAIIQRPNPTRNALSSVFWFSLGISICFALACFPIAELTAYLFHEARVIPLTRAVSALFIINGLQIVPANLLRKELDFKKVSIINFTSVVASCGFMLLLANLGAGVWTLLGGHLFRSTIKLVMTYAFARWMPSFRFDASTARSYLSFGFTVSMARSLTYLYQNSDRFFAGRFWAPPMVGLYSFALNLAQLPTEKITVIINQVSFPAFSKLQNDPVEFNRFYLHALRVTATLVLPLFVCGFLLAGDLIPVLLGDKWLPMIPVFRFLCLTQIVTSINAINDFVHNAQNRPRWFLVNSLGLAIFMPLSFYFAAQRGLYAMPIPWSTTYVVLCAIWILVTLRKLGIPVRLYGANLVQAVLATVAMAAAVLVVRTGWGMLPDGWTPRFLSLGIQILTAGASYLTWLWIFDRQLFHEFRRLRAA